MMKNNRKILLEQIGFSKPEDEITLSEWDHISESTQMSEEIIGEFKDKLNWYCISLHQNLSEGFIRDFEDYVFWDCISAKQILSEDFIRKYQGKVNWNFILRKQTLSTEFIREFENNFDWTYISEYHNPSIDFPSINFLVEFQYKIDWEIYFTHQAASYEIIKKFIFKTTHRNIRSINTRHLTADQIKEIEKMLTLKYMFVK